MGNNPADLQVTNESIAYLDAQGTATIKGNYTNFGTTKLELGLLNVTGVAGQAGANSSIQILGRTTFITDNLYIRNGSIIGDRTVQGNLVLGNDPGDVGYNPNDPNLATTPIIAPGGGYIDDPNDNNPKAGAQSAFGTLDVTGNFQMFSGKMIIEIGGSAEGQYDRVRVLTPGKQIILSGTSGTAAFGGQAEGHLVANYAAITTDPIPFLKYKARSGDFVPSPQFPDGIKNPDVNTPAGITWTHGKTENVDPKQYWFKPSQAFGPAAPGKIGGFVWRDNGAVAGIYEPNSEQKLSGVTVQLLDSTGTTVLASTTTDANGGYQFANRDPGLYYVRFVPPAGDRFAPQDVGTDDTIDSDPDPVTGLAAVWLEDGDQTNTDAGMYANSAPVIGGDTFQYWHQDTPTHWTISLMYSDTPYSDADGDSLTVSLVTGPTHGGLTLNADGTFTYSPTTGYTGTDTFTYRVSDAYGGSATATVTLDVTATPAPQGVDATYTVDGGQLDVDAESGVLAGGVEQGGQQSSAMMTNGFGENTDTPIAVLVSGPSHGTLTLNEDGSFDYTPDDGFVSTDSFVYQPADDNGPGTLGTASRSRSPTTRRSPPTTRPRPPATTRSRSTCWPTTPTRTTTRSPSSAPPTASTGRPPSTPTAASPTPRPPASPGRTGSCT